MTKIKAILSDFDGTLVDQDENFDPAIKNLIEKIQKKGVIFSMATGRAYYSRSVLRVQDELAIRGKHIFNNGALILNTVNMSTIWYQIIPQPTLNNLVTYFNKRKIFIFLEAFDSIYATQAETNPYYQKEISLKSISQLPKNSQILKIIISSSHNKMPENEIEKIRMDIEKKYSDLALIKYPSKGYYGMNVTSEKATKHTAALEYAKINAIDPKEMAGIGDNYNDYPLLTACGLKIAMDSSPKELKEIADLVVPEVQNKGMNKALEFILSKL